MFDPSSKVHQNSLIFKQTVSKLYFTVKDLSWVEQVQACVSDCRFFKSLSQSRNKDDVAQIGCPRDTVSCAATTRIYRKNIARHLSTIQFSTESNLLLLFYILLLLFSSPGMPQKCCYSRLALSSMFALVRGTLLVLTLRLDGYSRAVG